jgi:hypothetical protein
MGGAGDKDHHTAANNLATWQFVQKLSEGSLYTRNIGHSPIQDECSLLPCFLASRSVRIAGPHYRATSPTAKYPTLNFYPSFSSTPASKSPIHLHLTKR